MRAFQDYEIGWHGKTYVIPADHLLQVIAAVEEHITLPELLINAARRRMPMAQVSRAYAAILRAAGVLAADGKRPITEQEVYVGMFGGKGNLFQTTTAALDKAGTAIEGLLSLMVPPGDMQKGTPAPGKSRPASKRSKASTKRSLARAG